MVAKNLTLLKYICKSHHKYQAEYTNCLVDIVIYTDCVVDIVEYTDCLVGIVKYTDCLVYIVMCTDCDVDIVTDCVVDIFKYTDYLVDIFKYTDCLVDIVKYTDCSGRHGVTLRTLDNDSYNWGLANHYQILELKDRIWNVIFLSFF